MLVLVQELTGSSAGLHYMLASAKGQLKATQIANINEQPQARKCKEQLSTRQAMSKMKDDCKLRPPQA